LKLDPHQEIMVEQGRAVLDQYGWVMLSCYMRTGKTLASIEIARSYDGVLVVTKKAAIEGWQDDMNKAGVSFYVTNYESLHKIPSELKFGAVVIDECHKVSSFPKPNKIYKVLKALIKKNKAKSILLSGTMVVESICQVYHQVRVTGCSLWDDFRSFYSWHREFGIHKVSRRAGGMEGPDYSEGDFDLVMKELNPFVVTMTQKEAGFKQTAQVIPHYIDNFKLGRLVEKIKKDNVVEINDRWFVGLNPASVLQKMHMCSGGTLKDDRGNGMILEDYDPFYKCEYINSKMVEGKKYAIFTQYEHERLLIGAYFAGRTTDDMDAFKRGDCDIFVGSMTVWCEGVDLSLIDGAMILYSLNWSGTTYMQILERMNNKRRVDPIRVHVLIHAQGVDEDVFEAVKNKENFNKSFYSSAK